MLRINKISKFITLICLLAALTVGAHEGDQILDNVQPEGGGTLDVQNLSEDAQTAVQDVSVGGDLSGTVGNASESDPVFTAWDKDYDDLTNTPDIFDLLGLTSPGSLDRYPMWYGSGSTWVWSVGTGGGGSMIYPNAGITVSTGSAWGTPITDNSANWNTAYGWGDHSLAGYLTSEVDGSVTNEIEVVDETYNSTNFDGATTEAVSQDDFFDYNHIADTDDDGLPDVVDLVTGGFVKTDSSGNLSVDTNTYLTGSSLTNGYIPYYSSGLANSGLYWDGTNLGIGTATPSAKFHALATTEQLRLGYDASNYSSFTTSSNGDLTIAPSGGDTSVTGTLAVSSSIIAGGSGTIGYGGSAGASVTQLTSKSTAVTINAVCGRITTHNAALAAAAEVSFQVNNSFITGTEAIVVSWSAGGTAGAYIVFVSAVNSGGYFRITISNCSTGSLSEVLQINFAIIKGDS